MAVPQRKTSKSKNKMRQAGKGLVKKTNLKLDEKGEVSMSHILLIKRIKKRKTEQVEQEETKRRPKVSE